LLKGGIALVKGSHDAWYPMILSRNAISEITDCPPLRQPIRDCPDFALGAFNEGAGNRVGGFDPLARDKR
jgi:hypothetical protein